MSRWNTPVVMHFLKKERYPRRCLQKSYAGQIDYAACVAQTVLSSIMYICLFVSL